MASIEQRGPGQWRVGIRTSVEDGRRWIRRSLSFPADMPMPEQRARAELAAAQLQLEYEQGEVARQPEPITVRDFAEIWITKHVIPNCSPNTLKNYRFFLDSRILPALGDKPLPDLTPAVLTDWLFNLRKDKRKTTRLPEEKLSRPRRASEQLPPASSAPLSVKTALNYYGCIKTMLAAAVRTGLLEYNPMDRVQRPKKRKKKKATLPEQEVVALLQLIITEAPTPLKLAVLLAMLCSLRLGEVGALRYTSVNWEAGTITVDRALKYTPATGSFIAETKTDAGDRVITLPPSMIAILREALWQDVMEEQDDPEHWQGSRWIVHSRHGARVNKDTPSKWFRKFADAHGYPELTFHGLRHVHATVLLQHNIDLQSVSSRMGHSDPSVTLRAYADAMPARDQEAAATMDHLLTAAAPDHLPAAAADPFNQGDGRDSL